MVTKHPVIILKYLNATFFLYNTIYFLIDCLSFFALNFRFYWNTWSKPTEQKMRNM